MVLTGGCLEYLRGLLTKVGDRCTVGAKFERGNDETECFENMNVTREQNDRLVCQYRLLLAVTRALDDAVRHHHSYSGAQNAWQSF